MNNLLKTLSIMFVFSLLSLPLTGCDNPPWESGMVLILKVDTPKDGATVNTSTVTVSGRVKGTESAGAKVSINGADAPVQDGKFSTNVTLTEGKNIIKISAKGGQASPEEIRTVNYTK